MPGVSAPVTVPGLGEWTSAVGSMNHVAFNVPEDRFLEYRAKLKAKGVRVSPVIDHDDSEFGVDQGQHHTRTPVRSAAVFGSCRTSPGWPMTRRQHANSSRMPSGSWK